MDGRVEGWVDGRVEGWVDGRVGGWVDGRVGGWVDGRVGGWVDGRVGGWVDGRVGGWDLPELSVVLEGESHILLLLLRHQHPLLRPVWASHVWCGRPSCDMQ